MKEIILEYSFLSLNPHAFFYLPQTCGELSRTIMQITFGEIPACFRQACPVQTGLR